MLCSFRLYQIDHTLTHVANLQRALRCWQVDDPTKYGVVVMDEYGQVQRFVEKPKVRGVGTGAAQRVPHCARAHGVMGPRIGFARGCMQPVPKCATRTVKLAMRTARTREGVLDYLDGRMHSQCERVAGQGSDHCAEATGLWPCTVCPALDMCPAVFLTGMAYLLAAPSTTCITITPSTQSANPLLLHWHVMAFTSHIRTGTYTLHPTPSPGTALGTQPGSPKYVYGCGIERCSGERTVHSC